MKTTTARRMTDDEIDALAIAARRGGSAALDDLVRALDWLPRVVAREMPRRHAHLLDDFAAAGMVALLETLGAWKPEGGCRFRAHARRHMRFAMLDEINALTAAVRLPDDVRKVRDDPEWRARMSPEKLAAAEAARKAAVHPEAWADRDGDGRAGLASLAVARPMPLDDMLDGRSHREDVRRAVRRHADALPPEDREFVALRYGLDGEMPTPLEMAGRLGVADSNVSVRVRRILADLQDAMAGDAAVAGAIGGVDPASAPEHRGAPVPGHPGLYRHHSGRIRASIRHRYRNYHVGSFGTVEEAAAAMAAKRAELGIPAPSKNPYFGIYPYKGRWEVRVKRGGVSIYLGRARTRDEAVILRDREMVRRGLA